jgi:uncharacterized protein YecE (DUF72 family)
MIAIGTSSWSFDAWRGVFYPETLPKTEMLAHYAQHFPTVEVNTSFYALPEPSTLIKWVESVPAGFTFALKFPRRISHEKRLVDCETETRTLIDALHALGEYAGPAFLQLPPDFSRKRYGRELANYLDWLATWRDDLPMAVEVRARDLMSEAFARFLAERGFALVLADRKGNADLFDIWAEVGVNSRLAMIRWIGDDRNGPQGDRELSAPQDEKLDEWAARMAQLEDAGMAVFGYVHNPYEGHSPETVRRLLARLGERVLPWPPDGAGKGLLAEDDSPEGSTGDGSTGDGSTDEDGGQLPLL